MHALRKIGIAALFMAGNAAAISPPANAMSYGQCLTVVMQEGYNNHRNTPLGIRIWAAKLTCEQFII